MLKYERGFLYLILILTSQYANALAINSRCDFFNDYPAERFNMIVKSAPSVHPAAIPKIHVEGSLPHTGIYDISANALRDFSYMRALGVVVKNSDNVEAVQKLSSYFDSWTNTYIPDFNPIDETLFDGFIDSYLLSKEKLPPTTDNNVKKFLYKMASGYLVAMKEHSSSNDDVWISNWQSHRIKILTMIAYALKDNNLYDDAKFFFRRQINMNIFQNGEVWDFQQRGALYYVVYDLEPLVRAALIAQENGDDWLRLEGDKKQSLETALDWLLPYARGEKKHIDFEKTTKKFDSLRKKYGVHGFNGEWEPSSAANLYWSASLLNTKYRKIAISLSNTSPFWLMGISNCY